MVLLFFPPSGVLDCFHSRKQLFTKVLIVSMLQNSACSQVNQGCTDVLLKEDLMKVAQCFAAHSRLLNSQSTFTRPLFDDESVSVIRFLPPSQSSDWLPKGETCNQSFIVWLPFSPALMQLDTRSRLFEFLAHGLVSLRLDFPQLYFICRNLHGNSCSVIL